MRRSVLLLNQGYQPLRVISWRKAISLCFGRGKAEIVTGWEDKENHIFNAAVVRLVVPSPDPFKIFQKQKFSRRNLYVRDRYSCQYCLLPLNMSTGTIDHVIPRAQGGKTTYLNCAVACKPCNSTKDNRTPVQANMPLAKPLRYPNMYDMFSSINIPFEWSTYITK